MFTHYPANFTHYPVSFSLFTFLSLKIPFTPKQYSNGGKIGL